MENRVVQQAIRKLADLFPNESGRVGAKSALAMGAVVGAAAVAQILFTSYRAYSDDACQWSSTCGGGCCCQYFLNQPGTDPCHRHCFASEQACINGTPQNAYGHHCHDGGANPNSCLS